MDRTINDARTPIAASRRVVVKLGTRVLTAADGGIALSRLASVLEDVVQFRRRGGEPLVVTSGAVGLGRDVLGLPGTPTELGMRQLCAAVGQSHLMELYQQLFSRLGTVCAQVLLTQQDFASRRRYLNLRGVLQLMLARGIVPIINENDVVATEELALTGKPELPVFSDNDRLSALVAAELDAHLLVLLTDVEGVCATDPAGNLDAAIIARVDPDRPLSAELGQSRSGVGRGGMASKVQSATIAAQSGCHVVIASGLVSGQLGKILTGEPVGTWFAPHAPLKARDRWIAFAAQVKGTLHVDAGAKRALTQHRSSLLAAGLTAVDGEFHRGDIVEVRGPTKETFARGVVEWDASRIRAGLHAQPEQVHRLIHADNIVLTSATAVQDGRADVQDAKKDTGAHS